MLSELFVIVGTALSCVYGIRKESVEEGFPSPSFEKSTKLRDERVETGESCFEESRESVLSEESVSETQEFCSKEEKVFGVPTQNASSEKLIPLDGSNNEDLFKFATREKLRYDFTLNNPSDYKFEILRYQGSKMKLVCEAQQSFSVELIPATYYLRVSADNSSKFASEAYTVDYKTVRVSNNTPFLGAKSYPFKMILWENEIWPCNAPRRGKDDKIIKKYLKTRRGPLAHGRYYGYVDPILTVNGTSDPETSEEYLESVLYIIDHDLQNQACKYFVSICGSLQARIKAEKIARLKMEAVKNSAELVFKILGYTPAGDLLEIFSDAIKFATGTSELANLISYVALSNSEASVSEDADGNKSCQLLTFFSSLATACDWAVETEKCCVEIPRYYKIEEEKAQNSSYAKTYYWHLKTSPLVSGFANIGEHFKHQGFDFSPVVESKSNGVKYTGCLNLLFGENALQKLFEKEETGIDGE